MTQYLVQKRCPGETEIWCSLMSYYELMEYVSMSDCHEQEYRIYVLNGWHKPKEIFYKGWQPNCLLEFVDKSGKVVLKGEGIDH